jgi:hypothetical protein
MAKKYGSAGYSTYEMADKRRWSGFVYEVIGIGIALFILYLLLHNREFHISGWGYLGLLFLALYLVRLADDHSRRQAKLTRRAERGAMAEEQVDDLLDSLDEDYTILNDLESPYGNIDHLVISQQNGIYLLETKSHHGKVTFQADRILLNGHPTEKDFIQQALSNSYWVKNQVKEVIGVSPWVTPVVVFTNAFVQYAHPIKGVRVLNKKFLLNFLQKPTSGNPAGPLVWRNQERIIAHLNGEPQDPTPCGTLPLASQDDRFCPRCGAPPERRKAVRGEHIGEDYLVCTKFPACKTFYLAGNDSTPPER